MHILLLRTFTVELENKERGILAAGHRLTSVIYDEVPYEQHEEVFVPLVDRTAADIVVFVGAHPDFHRRPVLRPELLRELNKRAPVVAMFDDAACEVFEPVIANYIKEGAATLYVAVDGSDSVITNDPRGLVTLVPIDPGGFHPVPWEQRVQRKVAGFLGGLGEGERGQTVNYLRGRSLVEWTPGPVGGYERMAGMMCQYKLTFNHPMTGSLRRWHCKGRTVEAGFAKTAILERRGSPLEKWFTPDVDYLTYATPEEAADKILTTPDDVLRRMADHYHERVHNEHHPRVVWDKIAQKVEELR